MRLFICLKNTWFSEILYIDLMLTMRDHGHKTQRNICVGMVTLLEDLLMAFLEETQQQPTPLVSMRNFVHGETRSGEGYHFADLEDQRADQLGVDMLVHTVSLVLEGRESINWKPSRHKQSGELRVGNSEWIPNPIRPGSKEYLKLVAEKGASAWRPKIPQKFRVRFVHD